MERNHVLRNQPIIEGLHLILKVFQDVSWDISRWMVQNYYLAQFLDRINLYIEIAAQT